MSDLKIIRNPDTSKYAEATVAVFEHSGFCPSIIGRSDDTKCPCKEFREQDEIGYCRCGRYKKVREE